MKKSLTLLLVLLPVLCSAQLILSEIMYNPAGPDYYTEYIELYNMGSSNVHLTGWKITDGTGIDTLVSHTGSLPLLGPHCYALILDSGYWTSSDRIYDSAIPVGTLLLTTDDSGLGSAGLSNSISETVSLLDPSGNPVSSRTYLPSAPQGSSEEKIFLPGDNENENWAFSDSGGTPGYANSRAHADFDLAVDSVDVHPVTPLKTTENTLVFSVYLQNYAIEAAQSQTLRLYYEKNLTGIEESLYDTTFSYIREFKEWEIEFTFPGMMPGFHSFRAEWLVDDQDNSNNSKTDTCYISPDFHDLLMVEVLSTPSEDRPGEWIELVNSADIPLPVNGMTIKDTGNNTCHLDSLLNGEMVFLPDTCYIVAQMPEEMLEWPSVDSSKVVMSTGWATLNNDSEELQLFDANGVLIDHVIFPGSEVGIALQRTGFTNTPQIMQWIPSPSSEGATPGRSNPGISNPGEDPIIASSSNVVVSPNPFSPDGDSYEDQLLFSFEFPALTVEITLKVYDKNGRKIGTLLKDRLFDGTDEWEWDGKAGLDIDRLYTGIYVYTVEAVNSSGNSWKEKGVFATTGP